MATRQLAPRGSSRPPSGRRFGALLHTHKVLIGVLVGAGALLGISIPFALAYDESIDRQRSGFTDASTVVRLQTTLIDEGQEARAFELRPGDSVQIGDETFTPSPGNSVVSTVGEDGGLCVQVSNTDPDVRSWTFDSLDGERPYDEIPGGACGP